jgi:hypothetical protein
MHRDVGRRELLEQVLRVVAALDGADAFPQDREGIEALIGRIAEGRPSERREVLYEDPDELLRYAGGLTTWISPAGDGALRARRETFGAELISDAVVIHPDGRLSEFETIAGFGVPESELTDQARADLEAHERRQREEIDRDAEYQQQREEDQVRFAPANLIRTVAAPPDQDPAGPIVAYAVLYETGVSVDYLVPRPPEEVLQPEDPDDLWAEPYDEAMFPEAEIDDGLGTEYKVVDLDYVDMTSSPLRARLVWAPPVPARARCLRVTIGGGATELDLETS